MLRRLKKVLLSITATATVIIALLIVVSVVSQSYQFGATTSKSNIDIYTLRSNSGEPIQCYRDSSGFTVLTDDNGGIFSIQPVTSGAELKRCVEAYKSGQLPFDPRNYIGMYEAGYISWEGTDFTNIYDWDLPGECAPYYEFKQKSHPWLVDALGLVDTIEVTFRWTGTDTEWLSCSTAREKEIAEIDLSELEIAPIDSTTN